MSRFGNLKLMTKGDGVGLDVVLIDEMRESETKDDMDVEVECNVGSKEECSDDDGDDGYSGQGLKAHNLLKKIEGSRQEVCINAVGNEYIIYMGCRDDQR